MKPSNDEDTHDDDPANVIVRAGYLYGLASKPSREITDEDREMLRRAARSLMLFAQGKAV